MAIYFIYSYISTYQFNELVSFCVFLNRLESLLTDPKWPICLAFRSEKDQSGSFIKGSLDIQEFLQLYMTPFTRFIYSRNAMCRTALHDMIH